MDSKISMDEFFFYSQPWNDVESNSTRSGNQSKSDGWISPISFRMDLVIHRMPKRTFSGFLLNSDTNDKIHLEGQTILKIIQSCKTWIKQQ